MFSKQISIKPLAAALLLCAGGASQAAFTPYTSLASFNASVSNSGTDSFTSLVAGDVTDAPLTRTAGSRGYTVASSNLNPSITGLFGAGTALNPSLSTNDSIDTLLFSVFTGAPTTAIAGNFFASNISGQYAIGSVTVIVTDSSGATSSQVVAATGAATGSFFGFTSTVPITSLSVLAVQPASGSLWPTVDNLTLATAVPEAATHAMLATGVLLIGALARRRRPS